MNEFVILLDKILNANAINVLKPTEYKDVSHISLSGLNQWNYTYTENTRNDEVAAMQIVESIMHKFKPVIKFVPLYLPVTMPEVSSFLIRHNNIIARFIQDRIVMSDEIVNRFDILVHGEWK